MASNEATVRVVPSTDAVLHAHVHARPIRLSPLARGIGYRLAWAAGVSAALWVAVLWALS